ncbi:MAG: AEC family transporter [Hyphomicrobiales bacterium]|nr:AEC family transporter [Hyphomicrobiales bacterium]MBV9910233.1 AEC family transporter [Hyphomicrobiales bacterium]
MQHIVLILVSLGIGVCLRLTNRLPDNATKVLGGFVINVALPAAALHSVQNLTLTPDWALAAATPWIGAVVAILVIVPICRALGWPHQRAGALILLAGWGNTSFVGLPMISAFAGSQWMGLGIVIDLFGSYLALSTLGLAVASVASAGHFDWRAVVKRIATFPPFIALIVALAINRVERPDWFVELTDSLSQTLTPVALVAVGHALQIRKFGRKLAPLAVGLGYRLVAAPLLLLLIYLGLRQTGDPIAKVAMLEMAMPPMLGASIIALESDLEPELVALAIGVGVLLSMFTAAAWWSLFSSL